MAKNYDLVTISYQNGRYEVFDHINGSTTVGKINRYTSQKENLTAYGSIEITKDIVNEFENKRLKEEI